MTNVVAYKSQYKSEWNCEEAAKVECAKVGGSRVEVFQTVQGWAYKVYSA